MNETLAQQLIQPSAPPAVSWWPLAPGWWILIAVVLGLMLWYAWLVFLRWRANRARRVALRELAHIARHYEQNGDSVQLAKELSELLRRALLAYAPRKDVAGLTALLTVPWALKFLWAPAVDALRAALDRLLARVSAEWATLGREKPLFLKIAPDLTEAEIADLVRVDGTEGVALSIYKEAGANTVRASRRVRDAVEADVPILGICFGHQVVASVLGAPVSTTQVVASSVVGVGGGHQIVDVQVLQQGQLGLHLVAQRGPGGALGEAQRAGGGPGQALVVERAPPGVGVVRDRVGQADGAGLVGGQRQKRHVEPFKFRRIGHGVVGHGHADIEDTIAQIAIDVGQGRTVQTHLWPAIGRRAGAQIHRLRHAPRANVQG